MEHNFTLISIGCISDVHVQANKGKKSNFTLENTDKHRWQGLIAFTFDMMEWEAFTSEGLLPETHNLNLIMRNTIPVKAHSAKHISNAPQNSQGYHKQGKSEKLSQPRTTTYGNMTTECHILFSWIGHWDTKNVRWKLKESGWSMSLVNNINISLLGVTNLSY